MDSTDTPFTTERDERAAFAAKLATVADKADAKLAGRDRTFLSRAFFGGKKASAAGVKEEMRPDDASPGIDAPEEVTAESPAASGPEPALAPVPDIDQTQPQPEPAPVPDFIAPGPGPEATSQAATIPPASIISSTPAMPSEPPATPASNQPALAQLSLGFEIASLQLTPFFKLGGVQLKTNSNVVSLHLVAAQAQESPLAASISFQIESVELDGAQHFKSILLKPLGESREIAAPSSKLQVDAVVIAGNEEGAPISITSAQASAVQIFGTFAIAGMDFTPAFEIASLRLEPTSNTVLLRVAASSRPTALDLPPSFEVAQVQLGDGGQIAGMRLSPAAPKAS